MNRRAHKICYSWVLICVWNSLSDILNRNIYLRSNISRLWLPICEMKVIAMLLFLEDHEKKN